MISTPGGWVPARTGDGSFTLLHPGHGEGCHSLAGAWTEARERYALPCRLHERAASGELPTVRLLDVGTGLGLNIAAALEALAGTGAALDVLTLEVDAQVVRAGIALYEELGALARDPSMGQPPWEPWHQTVRRALSAAIAQEAPPRETELPPEGRLHLLLGDARSSLGALPDELRFDAVFLDPFSPRREPELWEQDFLAEVARRMAVGAWLSTYSAASRVRKGLSAAGLAVRAGGRVGTKAEGTLATRL